MGGHIRRIIRLTIVPQLRLYQQQRSWNKGWEVGIFAAVDQKNEGEKTALTKIEFEKMSVTDQQKYLITSSTQKGLESWGGSLGQENIS